MQSNKFMEMALVEAKKALLINEVPVGAVICYQDKIIATAHNLNNTNNSPLAHAEILAISQATTILNSKYLTNCDIYITLEPCMMCMGAISLSRIKRIYYGAKDAKFGALESNNIFWQKNYSYYKPEVYGNIAEEHSIKLLSQFFSDKRTKLKIPEIKNATTDLNHS